MQTIYETYRYIGMHVCMCVCVCVCVCSKKIKIQIVVTTFGTNA